MKRRTVGRWVLCRLGRHEWASHSTHMHFTVAGRAWSIMETPCVHCHATRINEVAFNDATPESPGAAENHPRVTRPSSPNQADPGAA